MAVDREVWVSGLTQSFRLLLDNRIGWLVLCLCLWSRVPGPWTRSLKLLSLLCVDVVSRVLNSLACESACGVSGDSDGSRDSEINSGPTDNHLSIVPLSWICKSRDLLGTFEGCWINHDSSYSG